MKPKPILALLSGDSAVIFVAFALTCGVLLVSLWLTERGTRRLADVSGEVDQAHRVATGLERLLSTLKDAETGQRGFVITGNPDFLRPHDEAVGRVWGEFEELQRLTSDDPSQQDRLGQLRPRIAAKLAELKGVIDLQRTDADAARAAVRTGRGEAEMGAVRKIVADMQDEERRRIAERGDRAGRVLRQSGAVGALTGTAGVLMIGAVFALVRRNDRLRKRASEAVAEQKERLRCTLASIGDAVISTDREGDVTYLSAVAESLTGWTNDEAAGVPLTRVFHIVNESTRRPVENPALRALKEGVIVGLANHTVLIGRDGSERPIDDSAAPIRGADGELVGCVLVFRDISERKALEAEQREAREQLATTLESITDGFMRLDRDWRLVYVNAEAERLVQRPRSESLGKTLWELFPAVVGTRLEAECRRCVNLQVAVEFENLYEPWGRWYDLKCYPTAGGGLTIYVRDITDQKMQREALAASEARFRELADAMPQIVYENDADGRVVFANRQWLTYTGQSDAQTGDLGPVVHPDDLGDMVRLWEAAKAAGTTLQAEFRLRRAADGEYRWFLTRAVPVRDGRNRVVKWFGTSTDIHDQKRAEEEIARLGAASERQRRLYETVLTNTPDFVYVFSLDHRVLYANDALIRMWGRGHGAIGKTFLEIGYEPWHAEMHDREIDQVRATRRPIRGEVPFTGTNGRRQYDYIFVPVIGADGEVEAVAGTTRDVTERKEAERAIRAGEERLRTALAAARMVAWEWTPADGKLRVSENAADVFGLPAGVGLTGIDQGLALLHPDDVTGYRETFQKAIDERGSYLTRYRLIRPDDGRTIWIEERGHAVFDQPGGAVRLYGVAVDVTGRVRAEADRERLLLRVEGERGRLADVFRQAPAFMCVLRGSGHVFEMANDQYYTLVDQRGLLGKTVREALPEVEEQGFIHLLDGVYRTGEPFIGTGVRLRFDQVGERYVDFVYQPLRDPDGAVTGVMVVGVDVTARHQAEEALRLSEYRYRTLFDTMDEGFCVVEVAFDPAGRPTDYRIEEMNPAFEKHTGMHGLVGRSVRQAIPALEEFWYETYGRVAATGEPSRFVHRAEPMGGRWFEVYAFRLGGDGSNKVAVLFNDVSARERAERAVRDSEAHFRSMADNAPTILWVTDAAGSCTYLSSQWYEYTGRQPGADVGFGWLGAVHPDDLAATRAAFLDANGRQVPFRTDYRLRRRDGEYRWAVDAGLPRFGGGTYEGMVGCVLDVHERKQAEQLSRFVAGVSATLADLTDSVSTFQKIAVMTVPYFADWCAVDMVDDDGLPRRVATMHADPEKVREFAALLAKYPPRADDPHGILKVIRTSESELVEEITDALLESVTHDEHHFRRLKALGLRSHILVPIRSHGRVLGVVTFITAESGRRYTAADLVVAEDLASRAAVAVENARLYQALQEADRRKDEFLATLAHELRNPLAPIRNAVQVFRLKGADDPDLRRGRDVIDRQVAHLTRLIDDLLDISRIARNKLELRRGLVTLADAVAGAVETSRPLIEQMGHDLTVELPPDPVYLDADLIRLSQVFMNLLTNAAKYTPQGGRIWLTAVRDHGDVLVAVRDTGLGVPAEKLPNLFEMFFQVDGTLEKSQGGLGIGLSLVRRLVEMHGGTVAAHSDGPGTGSEFVVRLPVLEQRPDARPVPEGRADAPPRESTTRRVLVVDDNRDAADTLAMLLELTGHEVRTAHDGEAGVAAAGAFRPDAVLMDIGMPKLNGYEACRRIREQPWGKEMLLIALTGWGQDDDRRRTDDAGFDAHLVKPVDHAALTKLLAGLPRSPS